MRIRHVNAVIFHILLFLCGTLFFWTSNAVASEQNQVPISVLADKARTALTEKDEETFYTHMDHIFERITGIPASSLKVPEGMGDDESSRKMCEYTKVSEQILTPEILGVMRHQSALIAYSAVLDGVEDDLIKSGITDCTYDDGQPVKTAQFMIDGIAWAQAFQSADAAQAQAMAQDIKALSQRNPQVGELAKLAKLVGFHAQDKQLAENPKPKNRVQNTSLGAFQARLVEKAHKGDLSTQLEVARRLEIGDQFRQDNPMAYFWYKRAHQNGGGEEAQAGMDRLLPHLTEANLSSIDVWTRRNHRPY